MYTQNIQLRWSDIDANHHLRHSAYYDFGAAVRMNYLSSHGLDTEKFRALNIGPVLLREEAVFRREIRLEDQITLDLVMIKAKPDYSRWSFRHRFLKGDGLLAATITIDGAWIDIAKRKFAMPDAYIRSIFENIPRSEDFLPL